MNRSWGRSIIRMMVNAKALWCDRHSADATVRPLLRRHLQWLRRAQAKVRA